MKTQVKLSVLVLLSVSIQSLATAQNRSVTGGSNTVQGSALQGSASAGSATQGSANVGSGNQGSGTQGSGTVGSGSANPIPGANMPVAMNGFCAVCILDAKKWVKGSQRFAVLLDGKKYLFPGEEQRKKFIANTTKYTPALGGDCVVCAMDGARVPGSVFHAAIHKGRLFMFPSDVEKSKFMADPVKYEDLDLALDGMCAVCKVEMNKDQPGDPAIGTMFGGKRYYFPSMEQKRMFLANPSKYAVD